MKEIETCFKGNLDLGSKFEEWNGRFVHVEKLMDIYKDEMKQYIMKIATNEQSNKIAMNRIDELASDEIFKLKKGKLEELIENNSVFEARLDQRYQGLVDKVAKLDNFDEPLNNLSDQLAQALSKIQLNSSNITMLKEEFLRLET